MARALVALAAAAAFASAAASAPGAIPDEDWGYVDVRPGAHMFWWLYGKQNATGPRESAPLVMWLQGGPGAGGTGYGNFEEMGPLDTNLQPRNTTWAKAANLLFVDNPVGAGFSYVDDNSLLTTNNTQIAQDLVTLLTAFYKAYPTFVNTPFWVFCESYGGKMTSGFAASLLAAIDAGAIKSNFKGIALGDSWISPISFVDAWGPFLRSMDLLDANQAAQLQTTVSQCDQAVANGQWAQATNIWGSVEGAVEMFTDSVDFYNILVHDSYGVVGARADGTVVSAARSRMNPKRRISDAALKLAPAGIDHEQLQRLFTRHASVYLRDDLDALMNGPIKQKLGVIPASVTWGGQSDAAFTALSGDFMKPVVDVVDGLLKAGRINVTVYEGQVDLICCNSGAEAWMSTLTWPGMKSFNTATRTPRYPYQGAQTGAFVKRYGQLTKWDILLAGHMVPEDQGDMALVMFRDLIGA